MYQPRTHNTATDKPVIKQAYHIWKGLAIQIRIQIRVKNKQPTVPRPLPAAEPL
jgi:hypothetical protein